MLESSCFQLYEELGELKEAVESLDMGPVCLSGSGSTMFIICHEENQAHLDNTRDVLIERDRLQKHCREEQQMVGFERGTDMQITEVRVRLVRTKMIG